MSLTGPHAGSASELKARMEAEREGFPFLVLRDQAGAQQIIRLRADVKALTIGRSEDCGLALPWDALVSRVHAELVHVGGVDWAISDGGLSRNGTFLNGERVVERRRLSDGETIRFGTTSSLFRVPARSGEPAATVMAQEGPMPTDLSPPSGRCCGLCAVPLPTARRGRARPPTRRSRQSCIFRWRRSKATSACCSPSSTCPICHRTRSACAWPSGRWPSAP